ncbi:hypothetical protein [Pseudomonas serbica]|uniref:hypothetical protein n=1 Tax=Pseudomonas serbica TaxID=2965074 RepID=UPI00237BBAB9|nr:hypothetical protein [Pseudomonas serbica]
MSRTYRRKTEVYKDSFFGSLQGFNEEVGQALANGEQPASGVVSRRLRHAKDYDSFLKISWNRLHSEAGRHLCPYSFYRAPSWFRTLVCERRLRRTHKAQLHQALVVNRTEELTLRPFLKDAGWHYW